MLKVLHRVNVYVMGSVNETLVAAVKGAVPRGCSGAAAEKMRSGRGPSTCSGSSLPADV